MREYAGTNVRDPSAITKIDYFLRDLGPAIKLLTEGLNPSGGTTIINNGVTDHGLLTGLIPDDDHAQYLYTYPQTNSGVGRAGGQFLVGGTAAGEDLTLKGTSHSTPGTVIVKSTATTSNTNMVELHDSGGTARMGMRYETGFAAGIQSSIIHGAGAGTRPGLSLLAESSTSLGGKVILEADAAGSSVDFYGEAYAFHSGDNVTEASIVEIDVGISDGCRFSINSGAGVGSGAFSIKRGALGGTTFSGTGFTALIDNHTDTTNADVNLIIARGGNGANVQTNNLLEFRKGAAESVGGGGLLSYFDVDGVFHGGIASSSSTFSQPITIQADFGAAPTFITLEDTATTNTLTLDLSGAISVGGNTMVFPAGGGTMLTTSNTANVSGKTFTGTTTVNAVSTNVINCTSTGPRFRDSTSSTEYFTLDLAAISGARVWSGQDLTGALVMVGNDPPAVAAGALGKVDLTGQTAAIGSTNLSNTPPAGTYAVEVYAACTTASGSGSPTLDVTIGWTDVVGATTANAAGLNGTTFPLALSATGRAQARFFIQVASGNITYSTTINAASGSPQYAIYIRVVALG